MSEQNSDQYQYRQERYLLQTLDPLHVGAGGNRLGRVDNSIVREPGTKLPKIPGTALHGAIRQYAAYRYDKPRCAGQGQASKGREGHCGRPTCPICYTFGAISGEQSFSGVVSISDARLLLFPVYSLAGPVWVTCPAILAEFGVTENVLAGQVRLPQALSTHSHLNLGWLMLPKADDDFKWPEKIIHVSEKIKNRAVLVSDELFSQIVNSNLEVRTSVSIDPETGAAEEGHLFTYEAIPRAAILWLDVVVDDYRAAFPVTSKRFNKQNNQDNDGEDLNIAWNGPADVVTAGLELAEMLGVGGMGTRGFGRVRLLNGGSGS